MDVLEIILVIVVGIGTGLLLPYFLGSISINNPNHAEPDDVQNNNLPDYESNPPPPQVPTNFDKLMKMIGKDKK